MNGLMRLHWDVWHASFPVTPVMFRPCLHVCFVWAILLVPDLSWSNPFARNEGRSSKTEVKLRFYLCRTCPGATLSHEMRVDAVFWHHQNLFNEIGFQWSQFSTMATAMSLSSWIFVVRRSSFGSPVEPCLMSRSGTCQLKEPFWPCRRRFVDSLLYSQTVDAFLSP